MPATVDIDLEWRASGSYEDRGSGLGVDPTDPAAFLGSFTESTCAGRVSGREIGFAFSSGMLNASGYYAQFGTQRNGAYLS